MSAGDDVQEVRHWRLLAAIVWHFILLLPSVGVWAVVTRSWGSWVWGSLRLLIYALFLEGVQIPVLLVHRNMMMPSPSPPASADPKTDPWASVMAMAGKEAVKVGTLVMAYVMSGLVGLPLLRTLSTGGSLLATDAGFGALLGLCCCTRPLLAGDYIIVFPIVHRHRFFRLKHRLPETLSTALWATLVTLLFYVSAALLPYHFPGVSSLGLPDLLWMLPTSVLVTFGWSASFQTLEVVHTERHMFLSSTPNATPENHCAALLAGMRAGHNPLVKHLAYQDMCEVSQQPRPTAWRRNALFESTAGSWTELVLLCAAPVNALNAAMLPVVTPLMQAPKGSVLEELSKASPKQACVAAATWHLRKNFQVCSWGITGLGNFATAARKEDVYGILQLKEPTLGTVTSTLLSCLLSLRVCMNAAIDPAMPPAGTMFKWVSSDVSLPKGNPVGASRSYHAAPNLLHSLHKPCVALADLVQTALYKLVVVYGDELVKAIEGKVPAFGDAQGHAALLRSMLGFSG